MLVTLIISGIAAFAFRSAARKKGYHSPRIWMYPLMVGAGISVAAFVLMVVVNVVFMRSDSVVLRNYPTIVGVLSVILLFAVLPRAWKQIKALPVKKPSPELRDQS